MKGRENEKAVGAVCLGKVSSSRELSFEEILLDEKLIESDIWIWKTALGDVGGMNYRLHAKQNYELLLRIAKKYKVFQISKESWEEYISQKGEEWRERWVYLKPETAIKENNIEFEEGLKTDCYLIGRYTAELHSMGCFEDAVAGIIAVCGETVKQYLKQMIMRTSAFYDIYDCTQPILIYTGSDLCFKVLHRFSLCMGQALEELGQHVEYFDISKHEIQELTGYISSRFKAVIGMQTYIFSARWQAQDKEGEFVHDKIAAPKYHFVFDHPIRLKDHLRKIPHRLCILEMDGNYVDFINTYYGNFARFLPPAGESEALFHDIKRDYEVTFLGSYDKGVLEYLQLLKRYDRNKARFINRYVLYMRKDLNETPERAFRRALDYYRLIYTKEEFIEKFYEERGVILLLAHYYRCKVIKTLLDSGISIHVFGDSWKESPVCDHPLLVRHEAVVGRDALKVYARSKLSLNIMLWHKDGFTERIANAMLQKSVVVTDRTSYLEKNFVNEKEILMFDLGHLKELPGRIKKLLENEEKREQIAEGGLKKALQHHTWAQRAKRILELIEEDR